jgi:hypothetical protein
MGFWRTTSILTRRRVNIVPLQPSKYFGFRVGIKLGVTSSDIPKVGFRDFLKVMMERSITLSAYIRYKIPITG